MALHSFPTDRFTSETGFRITVQVPQPDADRIIDQVLGLTRLKYGDYDAVTFETAPGTQRFRSLGSGHNASTATVVAVPCIELSFYIEKDEPLVAQAIEAIYAAHPYEEPVVFVESCLRTLHIRGVDEDNPNRFWNAAPASWVPEEHK